MNLDDAQKNKVRAWIDEGLKLAEIQNKLSAEYGLRLTYMETRFLMDDLKLKPKDKEAPPPPPKPAAPAPPAAAAGLAPFEGELPEEPAPVGGARVAVTVDQLTRPGSLVSGKVTFTDGNQADWYLDQTGRLGLVAKRQGYRPPESDLVSFQTQLHNELQKLGL